MLHLVLVQPIVRPDIRALGLGLLGGLAFLSLCLLYVPLEDVELGHFGIPSLVGIYVYFHYYGVLRPKDEDSPASYRGGGMVPGNIGDLLADMVEVTKGQEVDVAGIRYLVVFHLSVVSGKSKEALLPFDSITRRYRSLRQLRFVVVCNADPQLCRELLDSFQSSLQVPVFAAPHAEWVKDLLKPVTIFEMPFTAEATDGDAASDPVDAAASRIWQGHVQTLEPVLNTLMPPTSDSDDE